MIEFFTWIYGNSYVQDIIIITFIFTIVFLIRSYKNN